MTQKNLPTKSSSVDQIKLETNSDQSRPSTPSNVDCQPSSSNNTGAPCEPLGALSSIHPNKIRNLRKRSGSRISVSSDTSDKFSKSLPLRQNSEPPPMLRPIFDPNKKSTPMDELIKAASIMNPRQFELPREMSIHSSFPGSDKGNL